MFERRHYESVAKVIASAQEGARGNSAEECGVSSVMLKLTNLFAADNPNFDHKRFIKACGDDSGTVEWYTPKKEGIAQ